MVLKHALIPPLKENDTFISNSTEKAELLNNYFVAQSTLSSQNPAPVIPGQSLINHCRMSLSALMKY